MAEIKDVRRVMRVSGATSIALTEKTQEGDLFVRAFRVFGPDGEGAPPMFELQIDADAEDKITLQLPSSEF